MTPDSVRTRLVALLPLLGLAAPFAPAAEPAPAPRPLYPRFDLALMPAVEGQGVIGFRPAELARYATPAQAEQARSLLLAVFSQIFGGNDLDPAVWPKFADVEQCVLSLNMQVSPPGEDGRGTFVVGGKTPGLLKTTRAFDWAGLFRKSFPTAPARHAGREYLRVTIRVPFPLPFLGYLPGPMGVYTPDDRTVVVGSEEQIQALLDRLKAGDPPPAAPPGWADVDRDLIALALDNRKEPLVAGRLPADHPAGRDIGRLADAMETLAVGVSVGDETRVRMVATARDERRARAVARSLRGLFALGAEAAGPDPVEKLGAALLRGADVGRDGRTVTARLASPGNVLRVFLAGLGEAD